MDLMEFVSAGLASVLEILQMLDKQPCLPLTLKDRILHCHSDLRSFKLLYKFIINCAAGADQDANLKLHAVLPLLEEFERSDDEWDNLSFDGLITPKSFMSMLIEVCQYDWSGFSWDDVIAPLINQMKVLEEKLCFIEDLFDFSPKRRADLHKLGEFWSFMKGVMKYAACLPFLYGRGTRSYIRTSQGFGRLIPSKSPLSEKFEMSELVMSLFELLLADLVAPIKDRLEVFRERFIFLTTFLMNPPEKLGREAGDVILRRMVKIISDVASSISALYVVDIEMYVPPESEKILLGLLVEIDQVTAEIREVYVQIPDFLGSNFPVTNEIGFIDCLLGKLEEIVKSKACGIRFALDKILSVQEDFLSFRVFLEHVMELKHEAKDLWKRIMHIAYHAEHVVDSCLIDEIPIWYDMLSLSKIADEMKVIKTEIHEITNLEMCRVRKPDDGYHSGPLLPKRGNTSQIEDVFVGFKDEIQTIIDRLTRGTKQLDIISIVGMPGQGKTTLAKKVYEDLSVKYHFHKRAWCCVSQVYQTKELLLDILSEVRGNDIRISSSESCEDEIAEWLWKSLKGRRFLIVMDDIWDIGAWDSIKRVLPDEGVGSRIVFTSRIQNLVTQLDDKAKLFCVRFFDDVESWELLQKRLFYNDGCPSELLEIGKKMASKCKGLPLAIVLVAGILARKARTVDCWKEIVGILDSHIVSDQGFRDLVELSYRHLADHLKPCFLYFGAFREDEIIKVPKLMQLWTAEGLVPRNYVGRLDETAKEYLMGLIDRSLVTVAARNYIGEVKACRVHDLIYDFCLLKAREERFLHKFDVSSVSDDSPNSYEQCRLWIGSKWEQFINSRPAGTFVRSLVVSVMDKVWFNNPCTIFDLVHGFKFLHVLDMESINIGTIDLHEITFLAHLRYLALWVKIRYLPSSIAKLSYLQTLIFRGVFTGYLPDAFWAMKALRHIRIPFASYNTAAEFNELHNVVSFSKPLLASEEHIKELSRRLPRLRKLKFYSGHKGNPFLDFSGFNHLESLELDMLSHCHSYKVLSFDFPNILNKLTLRCRLERTAMSIIGKLPNLQFLKLQCVCFSNESWDLEDGEFLSLKVLKLLNVTLKYWIDCDESFPCLEHLIVKDWGFFDIVIPPSFGRISTLKRIEVNRPRQKLLNSVQQIVEEQRAMGNDDLEFYIDD